MIMNVLYFSAPLVRAFNGLPVLTIIFFPTLLCEVKLGRASTRSRYESRCDSVSFLDPTGL